MPRLHRVACHCRTVLLYFLARSACKRMPTGRVVEFRQRKEAHLPGPGSIATRMGTPGCGSPLASLALGLAFVIGKRKWAGLICCAARVAHVTDDSIPLFTSDRLPAYRHALLNTYGEW